MSIEDQIAELEKHVAKLHESNVQLVAFFEETHDSEYRDAIEENKVVIQRKTAMVVELRAALERGPVYDDDDEDDDADLHTN